MEKFESSAYSKERNLVKDAAFDFPIERFVRRQEAFGRSLERANQNPELAEALGKVDFGLLHDIYAELAKKAGIDTEKNTFIYPDRMLNLNPESMAGYLGSNSARGFYDAEYKIIGLNFENMKEDCESLGLSVDALLSHIVCHEEAHAVAGIRCRSSRIPLIAEKIESEMGYRRVVRERKGLVWSYHDLFALFNEGVTEILAREVWHEYMKRSGGINDSVAQERYSAILSIENGSAGYQEAVVFVDALAERISQASGIQKDTAKYALIRSGLEGLNLDETEVKKFFEEIGGPNFLEKLSNASSELDMIQLLKGLNDPSALASTTKKRSLKNYIPKKIKKYLF